MRPRVLILLLLLASLPAVAAVHPSGSPATTNNDDSCDISLLPAATLLLPYFEVEIDEPQSTALTTIFTIVNVTEQPQIARVTLWTDLAYPVLSFNVFLTGYDAQAINLYDVFVRGVIAPPNGTSNRTTPGERSLSNTTGNPRLKPSAAVNCANVSAPLSDSLRAAALVALSLGRANNCKVGSEHDAAVGYATIDVVADCTPRLPTDPNYFSDLLFDNVLAGDYEHIAPDPSFGNYAGGSPLVHIRAIPEGGNAGEVLPTSLPYTFYDTMNGVQRTRDRRQPLPSLFAARFIDGGATSFDTKLQIWREPATSSLGCPDDDAVLFSDVVTFDERENPFVNDIIVPHFPNPHQLPSTSATGLHDGIFPTVTSGDVGGWMYLNLHNPARTSRPSQAWVSTSMSAEGRYSTTMDVVALGNGCTPIVAAGATIDVPANANATPAASVAPSTLDNDDSCDIAMLPAATLLLPYFEVEINEPAGVARTTLFTVTNVTPRPQIANVTLWTDLGFPLLSFPIFLTGYDVQSINLYDVLVRAVIAPPNGTSNATTPGSRSASNLSGNPHFVPDAALNCANLPGRIPDFAFQMIRVAFTDGFFPQRCGSTRVGTPSDEVAKGYITIDVVSTCTPRSHEDPAYFQSDLLFDNVLTGDFQIIDPDGMTGNYASGNPMVHIRATPEGGNAGTSQTSNLQRTFYDRYLPNDRKGTDRRQPLPTAFMARWINSTMMSTDYLTWAQPATGTGAECPEYYYTNLTRVTEVVRFDERENPFVRQIRIGSPTPPPDDYITVAQRMALTERDFFPPVVSGDVAGWLYYRIGTGDTGDPTQGWVSVNLSAEGRYSVQFDATALGNGCSPILYGETEIIGPAPNQTPSN